MIRRALLFLFSHRLLAIARWEFQSLFVRFRNAIGLGNRGMARFVERRDKPTLLNLGSGPRGSVDSHWVNVDGVPYQNVHFLLDFNRALPFTDESFQGVFCEHVLEHFTLVEGERLLHDVKRILSKQGVVRIVVPDGEHLVRTYCESPRELVTRRNGGTDTPMEVLNMYFRQRYEHQFIYDWETLHNTLKRVGFNTITRSSFRGCTHSTCLVLDDPQYAWESLYVEAQK